MDKLEYKLPESETSKLRDTNNLSFQLRRFGFGWGVFHFLKNTAYRSLALVLLSMTRLKTGRKIYGFWSVVFAGMNMGYLSFIDFSTIKLGVWPFLEACFQAGVKFFHCLKSPELFLDGCLNKAMLVFTLLVVLLSLWNKVYEQLAHEKNKPQFHSLGKSIFLVILDAATDRSSLRLPFLQRAAEFVKRANEKCDLYGCWMRILEPLCWGSIGLGIASLAWKEVWSYDWFPVGTLIMLSSLAVMYAEKAEFDRQRFTR